MTLEDIYKEIMEVKAYVQRLEARIEGKDETLDMEEAAKFLHISVSRLSKISCPSNNIIPSTKASGGKKLFSRKALEQYLLDHQSESIAA